MDRRAGCLHYSLVLLQSTFLHWAPRKASSLLHHLIYGLEQYSPLWGRLPSELKEDCQTFSFLCSDRKCKVIGRPSQALCPVVLKVCHSPFPSALVTRISGQRSLWEKTRETILMYTYYGFTGSFFPETQPPLPAMENWTKFENWSNDQDFLLGHLSPAS